MQNAAPNRRLAGLWSAALAFGDLDEVGEGEDDAAAVEVERDLPAVGAGLQCALSDRGQAMGMKDLNRSRRREDLRNAGTS
jgi:hypothetical protein